MKKQGPALKKQGAVVKPQRPSSNTESGPGRPTKVVNVVRKVSNETKFQEKSDKATTIQKPVAVQQDVSIAPKLCHVVHLLVHHLLSDFWLFGSVFKL